MSEEQILDFLTKNVDYFVTNDLIVAIIRSVGWMLVKGVDYLVEGSRSIYNAAFDLIDITKYAGVQEFIGEYKPLLQALMVLSLVVLGYIYVLGKEKRYDLLTSLMIFAVVATSSTYLFSTFNSFTVMFKNAVVSGDSNTGGKELIRQNLYDLRYIDEQIGLVNMNAAGDIPQYPDLSETDMQMINISEVLKDEEEGLTDEAKDILSKRLVYVKGGSYLKDVGNGVAMTDFGNTYYFRYQFHYGTYFLNAFALIILYFGLGYVNVKVIVELLRNRVLVVLFSADLSSKKKAVRILESIRDGYYALCFTAIELRLYLILTDYINSKTALSPLVRGVLLVFVAFTMIEGSSIAEKITGVDAGITATTHRLMGAAHAVRGAAQMAMQAKQLGALSSMNRARSDVGERRNSGYERGLSGNGYTGSPEDGTSGMPGNGSTDKMNQSTGRTDTSGNRQDISGKTNSEMQSNVSGMENADFYGNTSSGETVDSDVKSAMYESETSGYTSSTDDRSDGHSTGTSPDMQNQNNLENDGVADTGFAKMNEELGREDPEVRGRYSGDQNGRIPMDYGHENKGMFDRWGEKQNMNSRLQQTGNHDPVTNQTYREKGGYPAAGTDHTGHRGSPSKSAESHIPNMAGRRERSRKFNDKKEKKDE